LIGNWSSFFFFHFLCIGLSRSFFFTISSSMSFFSIKFDLHSSYCCLFFFDKFYILIFFSLFHLSKLNLLGIKLFDWTRFKDFHDFHDCKIWGLTRVDSYIFFIVFFNPLTLRWSMIELHDIIQFAFEHIHLDITIG